MQGASGAARGWGEVKLDPREEHVMIAGAANGLGLFLRHLPAGTGAGRRGSVVLYVHGATFPSALSISHRFDGRSWPDELMDAGFDVWGFDFHGFGASERYPEMVQPAERHPPLGRAEHASEQITRVARFLCARHGVPRISIVAHSWGTIAAGRFAGRCPELVAVWCSSGPSRGGPNGPSRRAIPPGGW